MRVCKMVGLGGEGTAVRKALGGGHGGGVLELQVHDLGGGGRRPGIPASLPTSLPASSPASFIIYL